MRRGLRTDKQRVQRRCRSRPNRKGHAYTRAAVWDFLWHILLHIGSYLLLLLAALHHIGWAGIGDALATFATELLKAAVAIALAIGTAVIVALLLLARLLPRPRATGAGPSRREAITGGSND